MSSITEKKQNFLFDEIIGQGYDAEVFMNFMAEAKEDGTNIERWTMVELMNIVHEFKSTNLNSNHQEQSNQNSDQGNYSSAQMNSSQSSNQPQDGYYSAPPPKPQSINSSPVKNEETYLEKYEREQKELQQNEINLGRFQSGLQQSTSQNYHQGSQSQQQQAQQPTLHQQSSQQQRPSVSGGLQQQQNQQSSANNQPQNNKNQQSQSNSNKKNDDPFALGNSTVPPSNNQAKPAFSTTIAYDPGLDSLIKKNNNDFDFETGFNQGGKVASNASSFQNNSIWNITVQQNGAISNNQQQDIWNMGSSSNNVSTLNNNASDPFSSFNMTQSTTINNQNAADPFQLFNSTAPVANGQGAQHANTGGNDPFGTFFTTPQTHQNQKIPTQPPAPVTQTPPTQNISDIDLDDFFGVKANNNKPTQNKPGQPQINQQKPNTTNTAATAGGAAALAAIGGKAALNNQQKQPATQQQQQQQQKQIPQQNVPQKPISSQKVEIAAQIKEPAISSGENKLNNEKFKSEKQCKKCIQTVVSVKPDVQVSIIEHEIVSGSLFSIGGSSIAIYHVRTQPFNWLVKRKYNDFIWLRNILIKMYPGIPIPPLPGKTMKSLDEKLVQRRKGYFESFLFEILSQPDLKSSKFITDFLSISDEKIFKQRVKETEKIVRPRNLNEIESTTGKITLNKNPECNAHSQHLQEYFTENDSCYEKLKKLSKQLMEGYNHVGNILHQMGDTFAQLNANVITYDQKSMPSAQVKELEETYKIMNNMCVMQANSFSDQIKIFSNHFYNFFKFHKDNLTGLKEVVKTRNELNTILAKKDSNESSVLSGIFRSSKEAVHHPSKILKELDEQAGYYNEMMLQGSRKILSNRATTYSKHFMTYCNLQKSIVTEMGTVWQDISEHFTNVMNNEIGKRKLEIMKKVS